MDDTRLAYFADLAIDNAAMGSQDRHILRGDPEADEVTIESLRLNIMSVIRRALDEAGVVKP